MSARSAYLVLGALVALGAGACGSDKQPLDRTDLEDATKCQTCHPDHYRQWAGSLHAYASDDPVFRAMNARAQRENPATGTFCVQCHAPVAVRENLTPDGLNLDQLPASKKGVTCYFCHATESLPADASHNNPLVLAKDDSLFGPFDNPAPNTPHRGVYSALFDGATVASASACGSCHDIQNLQNAHVERTFEEWQSTLFAVTPGGESCAQCHMPGRDGVASTVSTTVRRLHDHAFPGVDVPVTPLPADDPQNDALRTSAQAMLDTVVQSTLCLNPLSSRLELTLDNISAGHGFPSGATPDRRVWIELTAFAAGEVIYKSGDSAALPLEASPDPDLWLMRDCLFDGSGQEVKMFWQPTTAVGDNIPGSAVQNIADPSSFTRTHVKKQYPDPDASPGATLPSMPDHVTVKVHLQAIGDDVLSDLVASGDLDPSVPAAVARYDLGGGAPLDWTPATATPNVDPNSGTLLCVTSGVWRSNTTPAQSHAHCVAPSP
jgi:hypothetical protein